MSTQRHYRVTVPQEIKYFSEFWSEELCTTLEESVRFSRNPKLAPSNPAILIRELRWNKLNSELNHSDNLERTTFSRNTNQELNDVIEWYSGRIWNPYICVLFLIKAQIFPIIQSEIREIILSIKSEWVPQLSKWLWERSVDIYNSISCLVGWVVLSWRLKTGEWDKAYHDWLQQRRSECQVRD